MPHRIWYVFRWQFTPRRAFVFVGHQFTARQLWQRRYEYESELHDALRSLETRPTTERLFAGALFATEARAIRKGVQAKLRSRGYKLLSARDRSTIRAGRKEPRPIYVTTCWGTHWFPSVRAAARALRVDHSTLSLAAKNPNRIDVFFESTPQHKKKQP